MQKKKKIQYIKQFYDEEVSTFGLREEREEMCSILRLLPPNVSQSDPSSFGVFDDITRHFSLLIRGGKTHFTLASRG